MSRSGHREVHDLLLDAGVVLRIYCFLAKLSAIVYYALLSSGHSETSAVVWNEVLARSIALCSCVVYTYPKTVAPVKRVRPSQPFSPRFHLALSAHPPPSSRSRLRFLGLRIAPTDLVSD